MRKLIQLFGYIIGVFILTVIVLAISLWTKSPGKADPITDSSGNELPASISTIEKINLGGVKQYLIIRGADSTKPVMLYLHGGPGSPEIAFMKETNQDIEKDFVMVYWEQRGAGKSYSKKIPVESMNLDQFISDTRELSEMLANRFNQEKIYLMGHSWGSFLGILTAYEHPELFHAYLGVGQVSYQYKSEQISFDWVKEQANKANAKDDIQALSEVTFPDSLSDVFAWEDFLMTERNYVMKYGGGVTRELKSMWPVIKMVLNAREYTFNEKMSFMPGSLFSLENLWLEVIHKNLFIEIDSMHLPVYIFQGNYDYQTSYDLAKEFYNQLKAPQKALFTFEKSAHSPMMEEVDKFNAILREKVLQ